MKIQNGFNVFLKLGLMAGLALSTQCFSMSLLKLGACCLAIPAQIVAVSALTHPGAMVLGLGLASYVLYNNKHTAPYVRPAVHYGVGLAGSGIKRFQRLVYVRPLEHALIALRERISNLTQRVSDLVSDNDGLQKKCDEAHENTCRMDTSIVRAEIGVQQVAQRTSDQALAMGQTLNAAARAASSIGTVAQSAYSLLASLSNDFQGSEGSTLFNSLHFAGEDAVLSGAIAAAQILSGIYI